MALVAVHSLSSFFRLQLQCFYRKVRKTKVSEKNPLEGVKFSVQVCYNGLTNPDLLPGRRRTCGRLAGPV